MAIPTSFGMWIYGRRPDGETVACKHGVDENGNHWVEATYPERIPGNKTLVLNSWITEFSSEEWRQIMSHTETSQQQRVSNEILRKRRVAAWRNGTPGQARR